MRRCSSAKQSQPQSTRSTWLATRAPRLHLSAARPSNRPKPPGDGRRASLKFDRFVVLTPSKPLARQAAIEIVRQRIGQPVVASLNYGVPNSGATISLYPRTYVDWAKSLLANDPSSVYTVQTGAITVSA